MKQQVKTTQLNPFEVKMASAQYNAKIALANRFIMEAVIKNPKLKVGELREGVYKGIFQNELTAKN